MVLERCRTLVVRSPKHEDRLPHRPGKFKIIKHVSEFHLLYNIAKCTKIIRKVMTIFHLVKCKTHTYSDDSSLFIWPNEKWVITLRTIFLFDQMKKWVMTLRIIFHLTKWKMSHNFTYDFRAFYNIVQQVVLDSRLEILESRIYSPDSRFRSLESRI